MPFATGPHAESRLERVARFTQPITLYPNTPEARRPASFAQRRFLLRVDRACGRLVQGGQLAALRHLGQPPEAGSTYRRWLRNLDRRIDLEGRQLQLWQRRDFAGAASLAARIATLRAQGNAAGIAFGLRSCTSEGPTGAPKS